MRVQYKALLFDLFRTLVLLHPQAPTMRVTEPSWRYAMEALRRPMRETLPGVAFDSFLDALVAVTGEIVRQRPPEYREVPVRVRYRRAFMRIGLAVPVAEEAAERFSLLQMHQFVTHSELPPEHRAFLEDLATRYRLGLVSNLDHGPTARAVLKRHGLSNIFAATLISDEFGRRKPHPEIFREALKRLETPVTEALHIGDSFVEDIQGAAGTGIDTAWINPTATPAPAAGPKPRFTVCNLTALQVLLA